MFAVGEYPEASLKAACAARDSARALVKKGTHPSHARRIELVNTIEARRETFKVVCEEWLGKKKTTWTPRRHIEVSRVLEADAYPFIGLLPMRSIAASPSRYNEKYNDPIHALVLAKIQQHSRR